MHGSDKMNLQQLKYILEVYKQGSINKASQTLFVTQPTLSIAIKELEKEIGFVIFERSSRGISPTPAGTAFINTVRDIFLKLENIKEQYIDENNEGSAPVLRISSSRYSFVSESIIDYYNNEVSSFDKYSIMVEEQDCNQVIQDVLSRKSDVGIIHTNLHTDMMHINLFEKKDIKYVKLFDSVPYIIFRKGHPLEKEKNITNEMLLKYPQIRTSSTNINYYDNDANFNFNEYINSDKNFFISSRSTIYNLLSNTDAIFFALTKYGVSHLHSEYTARPLNDEVSYFFYAIMLKTESRNKYVNDFINVLKKNVQ
mgnify:CR=1 FL=1